MATAGLDSLSNELLHEIVAYLEHTSWKSLKAFSATSWQNRHLCLDSLFKQIHVGKRVCTWHKRTWLHTHVRRLIVTKIVAQKTLKSLEALISELSRLTDIVYEFNSDLLPPSHIEWLSTRSVRIHLERLEFVSSMHPSSNYDMLVRLPNLHRVAVRYGMSFKAPAWLLQTDKYLDALRCMLAEAPQLRELTVDLSLGQGLPPGLNTRLDQSSNDAEQSIGALTALSLQSNGQIYTLESWMRWTDFGKLKTLTVGRFLDDTAWQRLCGVRLTQLSSLSLMVRSCNSAAASELFNSLHLRHLELIGSLERPALYAILRAQGDTLWSLQLEPSEWSPETSLHIRQDDLEVLVSSCRHITDMRVVVPRSGGDHAEVKLYNTIGKMKALVCLELDLDAVYQPTLMLAEGQNSYERTLDVLVNNALDEQLAKDIFAQICKDRSFPIGGLTLSFFRQFRSLSEYGFVQPYPHSHAIDCFARQFSGIRLTVDAQLQVSDVTRADSALTHNPNVKDPVLQTMHATLWPVDALRGSRRSWFSMALMGSAQTKQG